MSATQHGERVYDHPRPRYHWDYRHSEWQKLDMVNTTVKAVRATIYLWDIPLEVFQLPSGEYRLSLTQVLEAIGVSKNWISQLPGHAPERLKSLQNNGYSGITSPVKFDHADTKNTSIAKTLSIPDARHIWRLFDKQGNKLAGKIIDACIDESLEQRADAAFGAQRQTLEDQEFTRARSYGKTIRRQLTEAIADYIARHPDLSANYKQWLYPNVSDAVNLQVFNRRASQLCKDLNVHKNKLRDALTSDELDFVKNVENLAMRLIDIENIHPLDAVKQAGIRLIIPTQTRKATLEPAKV